MKTRSAAIAAFLFGLAGTAHSQTPQARPGPPSPPRVSEATAEVARLYDSLSARPGWPTTASEAEVDAQLARQGLRPEQRRAIIGLMRQDVCRVPEMVPVCRYYGAETIYKVQRLGWTGRGREAVAGRPAERPGNDIVIQQMRLMEYGAMRNLERLYGETGLSDAREAELNNAAGAARAAAGFSSQLSLWFACGTDERTLTDTGPFWRQYRLTTCGLGLGYYWRIVIFKWEWSFEVATLLTHSRFARKVGVWWLTGSEPTICANSVLQWSGNLQCNSYSWSSPVSFNANLVINSGPMSVVSMGSGARLNTGFVVTLVHQ